METLDARSVNDLRCLKKFEVAESEDREEKLTTLSRLLPFMFTKRTEEILLHFVLKIYVLAQKISILLAP